MAAARVHIVTPALASANNGNSHTAARWRDFLSAVAEVEVALDWNGDSADALIALHARRSASAIARFREAHPTRPLAVVLTGTDLYRDLDVDPLARHSLECASHVVVLQDEALRRLDAAARTKARVIVQSATRVPRPHPRPADAPDFVAVGHLRDEKDPLTLMQAVSLLPHERPMRVLHIGRALDESLAQAAHDTMVRHPAYRWVGPLEATAAREAIASARALVHMSRMEGGANVVIEAVRSGVPVLASRIDGNVGLLGADYGGYFEVRDAAGLARLMRRFLDDEVFAARLAAQCAAREPLFRPEVERAAVQALLADMLAAPAATILGSGPMPPSTPPIIPP